MKKLIKILPLFFCFLTKASITQEPLSILQAIDQGLENNFNISLAKKNQSISMTSNTMGQAGLYPTISTNATAGRSFLDQSNNPTAFIQDLITTNSIQGGANVSWTLFNGFSMHINKKLLEANYKSKTLETTLAIQNLIQAITLSYYEILIQEKIINQYEQNLNFSRDKLKWANIQKDLDYIAPIDYLLIKEAVLSDSILFIENQNNLKLARKQLNYLCNVDRNRKFTLTDQLEIDFIEEDYEALKGKVLNNSQHEQAYLNIQLKKLEGKDLTTNLYPSIGLDAGGVVSRSNNTIGEQDGIPGTNINYYVNFALRYTLFDGRKVNNAIQVNRIEQEIALLNKEQMSQELLHNFNNYYDSYNYFLSALTLSQQMLSINQDIQSKANELYKNGAYSHVQLREIQLRSVEGITAHYRQLKRLIDSKLEIDRLTQ